MRKVLLGFILLITLLFSCHSNVDIRREERISPLENALRATVAFVETRTETAADQTAQVYCSGFFISDRVIASALHCFQHMRIVNFHGHILQIPTVYDPTGDVVQFVRYGDIDMLTRRFINDIVNEAEVVYIDSENDLAILRLTENTEDAEHIITLAVEPPDVAQRVILVGHPHELVWSVVDGIVSRNIIVNGQLIVIQASIPLTGGYSGGPLMLPDGRAIGLASSYIGDMHHLSLFVASRLIAQGLFIHEMSRMNINNH
jgi:hypothetical protein